MLHIKSPYVSIISECVFGQDVPRRPQDNKPDDLWLSPASPVIAYVSSQAGRTVEHGGTLCWAQSIFMASKQHTWWPVDPQLKAFNITIHWDKSTCTTTTIYSEYQIELDNTETVHGNIAWLSSMRCRLICNRHWMSLQQSCLGPFYGKGTQSSNPPHQGRKIWEVTLAQGRKPERTVANDYVLD